jgi:hypothetical protein
MGLDRGSADAPGAAVVGNLRLMIDSNVFDQIIGDETLFDGCLRAVRSGSLSLVVTHVQADELAKMKDDGTGKRALLINAIERLAGTVETAGAVYGKSRWGMASYFAEDAATRHELYIGRSANRAEDALILATAERERIPFVTMESKGINVRRMRKHFPTVELWTLDMLRAAIYAQRTG